MYKLKDENICFYRMKSIYETTRNVYHKRQFGWDDGMLWLKMVIGNKECAEKLLGTPGEAQCVLGFLWEWPFSHLLDFFCLFCFTVFLFPWFAFCISFHLPPWNCIYHSNVLVGRDHSLGVCVLFCFVFCFLFFVFPRGATLGW